MIPDPPPGQGPIDPRGAFTPPPGAPRPANMPPVNLPTMNAPQMMMPPPYFYAPPPRPKFGFVRGIFYTLATTIFGASLLLNIYLLFLLGFTGNGMMQQTTLQSGNATDQVAVIPIEGVINSATADRIEKLFRELDDNSSIKAIVVAIDSPGGELTASDEIYMRLKKFKEDKKVPVVISMGGMATSGGYYIACAGDYIFAEPTTITANIGVVYERFNFSGLMEKYGVSDTSITPAGAKFKYIESPFRPDTPEAKAYLSGLVEEHYARFKSIVAAGRAGKLKASIETVADGRALSAADAQHEGLIDEIQYADAAYAKAASLAGISKPNVVRYKPQSGLFDMLGGVAMKISPAQVDGKVESPDVRIDRKLIDEIATPRLMSIYRGG